MFGKDRSSHTPPSSNGDSLSVAKLLALADSAYARNDYEQAAHLYLAAFDVASQTPAPVYPPALDGLRRAWEAACELKDRALCEHVFEKLEPYSSAEDIAHHAELLQRLALEKLEEFGFSSEDIQDMADMISEDFVESLRSPLGPAGFISQMVSSEQPGKTVVQGVLRWPPAPRKVDASKEESDEGTPEEDVSFSEPTAPVSAKAQPNYDTISGFDRVVSHMQGRGIGLGDDERFASLLHTLSQRHGIDSLPAYETLVFVSPSREDASQFAAATVSELGMPCVRMFTEQTPMGVPVLCVTASSDFRPNFASRGSFFGPGALVLEDVDIWGPTMLGDDFSDPDAANPYANLSRAARETLSFIRSAVDNPEVMVLATVSSEFPLDPALADVLYPLDCIDIDLPSPEERKAVWEDVFAQHPSMSHLDVEELVPLSANMSRGDIYSAAHEAVEHAFSVGVQQRSYVEVSRENIFEKIAAYQPLDSEEYRQLEDAVVEKLLDGLDDIDELLKGTV